MASTHTSSRSMDVRQSIEQPIRLDHTILEPKKLPSATNMMEMELEEQGHEQEEHSAQNGDFTRDNCATDTKSPLKKITSSTKIAEQTVAPYLAKHIPEQYAHPVQQVLTNSNPALPTKAQPKDPNTTYCYRHRPDSKCRRTAEEPTMESIQRGLESLPDVDRNGISHVWAIFSAAPARQRTLMLQGILSQCCFSQLSFLSGQVKDLIKIDFITALPAEIGYQILGHLDTVSLCKAAQVSQRWKQLADSDDVWHKMCVQHVNKKCKMCGWGLPLLEKQRLQDWKRQYNPETDRAVEKDASPSSSAGLDDNTNNNTNLAVSTPKSAIKRDASSFLADDSTSTSVEGSKRQCTEGVNSQISIAQPKKETMPWKHVYKDRYKVSTNWKYGRFVTKLFKGHTNSVMCLQFDDQILATGSLDSTVKMWDIKTGQCFRTLSGHRLGIRALQFDDSKLFSGSLDGTIKIWDWRTGNCLRTLQFSRSAVVSLDFQGNILVAGSADNTIKMWNFHDSSIYTLEAHEDWVNCVKIHLPSRTFFSASDDQTTKIWDLDTRTVLQTFEGHVGQVQQVTLLPPEYEEPDPEDTADDDALSPGREDSQGLEVDEAPQAQASMFASWPIDRPLPPRYIVTASLDSTLRLWSVDTGRCLKNFFGHFEGVWDVAGDNLRFVSGSEDTNIKIWDARTGKCGKTIVCGSAVNCVSVSDCQIAAGDNAGDARILSFKSEEVDALSPKARSPSFDHTAVAQRSAAHNN